MYKRYCDAMYNVCYRFLGSEPEAEDALQEMSTHLIRELTWHLSLMLHFR
jgi:DNA-directed RNA polymerase specialized sigma24 family protein